MTRPARRTAGPQIRPEDVGQPQRKATALTAVQIAFGGPVPFKLDAPGVYVASQRRISGGFGPINIVITDDESAEAFAEFCQQYLELKPRVFPDLKAEYERQQDERARRPSSALERDMTQAARNANDGRPPRRQAPTSNNIKQAKAWQLRQMRAAGMSLRAVAKVGRDHLSRELTTREIGKIIERASNMKLAEYRELQEAAEPLTHVDQMALALLGDGELGQQALNGQETGVTL